MREPGEDRGEINLTITQRPKAARPRKPGLIAAVNSLAAIRPEFCVLHVKHFDSFVIDVDVFQIIELLQHEMTGIIENVATLVSAETFEKHLKCDAIVQIFAGVNFKAQIDTH